MVKYFLPIRGAQMQGGAERSLCSALSLLDAQSLIVAGWRIEVKKKIVVRIGRRGDEETR